MVVEFWDSPLTISVLINVESSIPNRYKWKSSSVTCILNPNFNQVFTQLASESISRAKSFESRFSSKFTIHCTLITFVWNCFLGVQSITSCGKNECSLFCVNVLYPCPIKTPERSRTSRMISRRIFLSPFAPMMSFCYATWRMTSCCDVTGHPDITSQARILWERSHIQTGRRDRFYYLDRWCGR